MIFNTDNTENTISEVSMWTNGICKTQQSLSNNDSHIKDLIKVTGMREPQNREF